MTEMTIEELAARTGVKTTTVRMYQARGLLPGPRRAGRVGLYDDDHLARLRLIGQLQARGFSLAAIQQVVESWEQGEGLDDLLGLERRLPRLLGPGQPRVVDAEEVAGLLPAGADVPTVMKRATGLGLLRPTPEGRIELDDPALLDVGAVLVDLGLTADEVLDEYEHLRKVMDEVAARFVGVFERHAWQPFVEEGMPEGRLDEVTRTLERLGGLASQVVDGALHAALRRAAERFVVDEASREVASGPQKPGPARQ